MAVCTQDRGFLEAFLFNRIKTFEEQEKALSPRILQGIANIFCPESSASSIRSRDPPSPPGAERRLRYGPHGTGCRYRRVSEHESQWPRRHATCSDLVSQWRGKLQGFKYEINGQKTELGDQFACQPRDFLVANQLRKVIAVVSKPSMVCDCCHDSIEFMHPMENGTVLVSRHQADAADGDTMDLVLTEWTFSKIEQGIIECKGNKVCSPQNNGKHRVFVDFKLRSP